MRFFSYLDRRLYAPAETDTGGGAGAAILDGGLPHEHDDEPDDEPAGGAKKLSPAEERVAVLEQELKDERAERLRASDDAKFWANRGRTANNAEEESGDRVGEEDIELSAEEQEAATLRAKMTPEQMLEMLTTEGPKALQKLGFVTREQMTVEIARAEQRGERRVNAETANNRFEGQLAQEFPDIISDSNLVAAGKAPKTALFRRAGEIYRESVALDPSLKGSKSLLLISARRAAAELKLSPQTVGGERTPRGERGEERTTRRDRINAQRPPVEAGDTQEGDEDGPSNDQLHVAKMLGVSQKDLVKHSSGGRPAARGGRRG